MTKIETGKIHLHPTVFELSEIISVLERILYHMVKRNDLSLTIELPQELPVVQADKNKLKQIFMNLLSNAIKFTPAGGSVHLKVTYLNDEQKILVSVTDTGKGISENDFALIFEKFSQLDSGTTKKYGGIGLGLVITKYLIELHGGNIWVESVVSKGSTFYFKLPICQIPQKS